MMAPVIQSAVNGFSEEIAAVETAEAALKAIAERLRRQQEQAGQQEEAIRQLRAELKQTSFERDIYLRSLYVYSYEELKNTLKPFTEEEIREMDESGVSIEPLLAELETKWG